MEQREGDEFLETIELRISRDNLEYSHEFVSQLDTASPVSLIKSKFIPSSLTIENTDNGYVGLNGSTLQVLGRVEARIARGSSSADGVILRVVPDNTMKCDVLLGRDAIRSLGIVEIKREVNRKDATSEILNIDLGMSEGDEADKLKINPAVSNVTRDKFVRQFCEVYLQAEKPFEPKVKAEMKLHVKDKQSFHFAPGRLLYEEKSRVKEIVDDLLARGIIRPGNSEYASRVVLVKKKDGRTLLCVDYRVLNKITARDNYPLPIIEEQINALQGRYFSLLDLKDGFHHVRMAEDSIKYTAFVTPFGQYEYLKMPFGLKNAPARFQRFVNEVLGDEIRSGNVIVYIRAGI